MVNQNAKRMKTKTIHPKALLLWLFTLLSAGVAMAQQPAGGETKTLVSSGYAPDPAYWPQFVRKLSTFDAVSFDLGAENVRALACPVLIISGDNDGVDLYHVAEMYKLCGGGVFGDMAGLPASRLAIIPGMTHVSLMMETDKLMTLITPFLATEEK